ncbi:MAG: O-antigen ligase family protein [Prosthecobacter sp.]|uniref:O-antigen ligase family protein n=1 Tax=Prosthecobacter sp. TaxID=1965333 RepID=UPI003BB0D671
MEAHWWINQLPTILRSLALATMALCLCILPWANVKLPGSTHALIPWLACTAFVCWLLARILEWRSPRPHEKAVWWITLLISVYGWVVTSFPHAMVDRASGAILDLDKSPWLAFGTLDQEISVQAMFFITSALMLLVVALDFAFERTGRYVLALAVTFGGFVTAVAGLWLQTSADLSALWEVKHIPKFVFGLFWYHGNTAAFLNLSWPVGVWLCLLLLHHGLRTFRQQMALAFLMVAVMVQIIAVFVIISKVGHFLLIFEVVLLVVAGVVVWRPHLENLPFSKKRVALFVLIAVGLLVLGAWLSGAGAMLGRWDNFSQRHFDDPARRHAALMALQIGTDYGWTGTGPGTFEWVAAHYTPLDPMLQEGRWRHAHNDYAEFFAEWGWPGACFFVLLLAWPGRRLVNALRQAFSKDGRYRMSFERRAGLICFSTAIISVLLHAVVDFPLQINAIRPLFAALVGCVLAMTSTSASTSRRDTKEQGTRAWE